ncbi:MAG: transporter [Rhodospirillales bacterium]|nr:transporter [Rhodospirillales bacterium]
MTRRSTVRAAIGGSLFLALAGCATAQSPEAGFADVQTRVGERLAQPTQWIRGSAEDEAVAQSIRTLLARPLGPDEAVQVALLRNRSLQASYEEIGITQADVVQAGLLQNPVFSGLLRWSDRGGKPDLELGVTENFVSLLFAPARVQVAGAKYEATKARIASEVVDLAADTRDAFLTYAAASQLAQVLRESAKGAQVSVDLSKRLFDAGNVGELEYVREQAAYESARIELARAEAEAAAAREKVTRLMGLAGADASWRAIPKLPDLPAERLPFDRLEGLAIERNLRLAAAKAEAQGLAQSLGYARTFAWLGNAEIGVDTEREAAGDRLTGPSLQMPLPIFDTGQTERARAAGQLRQAEQRMLQQAIDLRSQVREQREKLIRTRALAEQYGKVVIPLQRRIVDLAMGHYNYMLIGIFDVLAAKQNEIAAYRAYVEATRDHWIARTELDRALGGPLPETLLAPAPIATTTTKRTRASATPAQAPGGHP